MIAMTKQLTANDIVSLEIAAGYTSETVTIAREDFEALLRDYRPYSYDSRGMLTR